MVRFKLVPKSGLAWRVLGCLVIVTLTALAVGAWIQSARARSRLTTADAFFTAMSRADHGRAVTFLCWTKDPAVAKRAWERRPARWGNSWRLLGKGMSETGPGLHILTYELLGTDGRRRMLRLEFYNSSLLYDVWVDGELVFLDPPEPMPSEVERR